MPTDVENKCCRHRDCVTDSLAFANLVLDRATLDTAIVHRIDFFVGNAPANYRKVTHRQYVIWKFGYLDSKTHLSTGGPRLLRCQPAVQDVELGLDQPHIKIKPLTCG